MHHPNANHLSLHILKNGFDGVAQVSSVTSAPLSHLEDMLVQYPFGPRPDDGFE
jgi:hypothetical protein